MIVGYLSSSLTYFDVVFNGLHWTLLHSSNRNENVKISFYVDFCHMGWLEKHSVIKKPFCEHFRSVFTSSFEILIKIKFAKFGQRLSSKFYVSFQTCKSNPTGYVNHNYQFCWCIKTNQEFIQMLNSWCIHVIC